MTLRIAVWTLAVAWLAGAAYLCWAGWPTIPLDVAAKDPAFQAAYQRAINQHVLRYALTGLLPAAILLLVSRFFSRRKPG